MYAVHMCRQDWRLRGSVAAPNAMHEVVLQSRPEMLSRLHLSSGEASSDPGRHSCCLLVSHLHRVAFVQLAECTLFVVALLGAHADSCMLRPVLRSTCWPSCAAPHVLAQLCCAPRDADLNGCTEHPVGSRRHQSIQVSSANSTVHLCCSLTMSN